MILASSGEWFKVVGVIFGMFAMVLVLAAVYSKITEKGNIKDKDGCGWPIFLVIVAVAIGILINLKNCQCKSSNNNQYDPDAEYWENAPRHTDKMY